ncbi:hypothetical protein A3C89_00505 [Candidatus Kaiserbacteria bacterium RIFCSPHIGHO2_02_FULL_50_50]|uniref:L,D-TPase catalytic domain-containing protein n=1 Tax=Candidatus Kaiserbacteria bacterium RIFCSPHIGHO2_02_FULL_50_50 TaxID=1798492 RepID=A0A1F6DFM4_9BACT|nr:MAG: hypothetical protein A3C89_00505 [Candidatus Kaiserbacteria bacterium RIFCSPHIGHO2_02_FULL_50_50]OGG88838.1 MAG: hypothetical protein A3G62_02945 [Candidatus Kaiserbacteria bacterium RIFCSPLOWO2_12_FULL_50_10]
MKRFVFIAFFLLYAGWAHAAERSIVIDLAAQTFVLYEGEHLVRSGTVSTGREGYDTPKGSFKVLSKERHRYSSKYKTPMLFSIRFHKGYFLHLGKPTGKPASAGCIRLSPEDSLFAFKFAKVGDTVIVR